MRAFRGQVDSLVNPPVSSREAFAELDARAAAERVAEHTGDDAFLLADKIADGIAAGARGTQLTSGERLIIAAVLRDHRQGR